MKLAVSSAALPPGDWNRILPAAADMGYAGIELAASDLNGDPRLLGRQVQQAGLEVVGIHSLLQSQSGLGLFQGKESRIRTESAVIRLSALCRDLGGRPLVLGGERFRLSLPLQNAWEALFRFLDVVLPAMEDHGTKLCLDPLGPGEADFCRTARDCRLLVDHVDHPSLGLQLGSSAMTENGDDGHAPFAALRGRLDIFHVAEPGLAALDVSGRVDHADFRRHLAAISYRDWICLHQRAGGDTWRNLKRSTVLLRNYYLRGDNLSLERMRNKASNNRSPFIQRKPESPHGTPHESNPEFHPR